jgi:hypothetical protein
MPIKPRRTQVGENREIQEAERHNRKADLAPRVDKKDAFQATKQSVGSIFDIN